MIKYLTSDILSNASLASETSFFGSNYGALILDRSNELMMGDKGRASMEG